MFQFGSMTLIAVPTNLADGSAIAVPAPVKLATLQDVTLDLSVDIKTHYGNGMFPLAAAQGKGKIEFKAKNAAISGSVLGSLYLGQNPIAGIRDAVIEFAAAIPAASPYTVTVVPPNSGTFVADLGIYNASGDPMTPVATAPTAGQYSVSPTGVYTFAAADASGGISMSYEYSAVSTSARIFEINNRNMGQTPSFSVLGRTASDGKILTVKFYRGVSSKLSLPFKNEDFSVPDFDITCFSNAAGKVGWICMQGDKS